MLVHEGQTTSLAIGLPLQRWDCFTMVPSWLYLHVRDGSDSAHLSKLWHVFQQSLQKEQSQQVNSLRRVGIIRDQHLLAAAACPGHHAPVRPTVRSSRSLVLHVTVGTAPSAHWKDRNEQTDTAICTIFHLPI